MCIARTGEEDGFDLEWRQVRVLGTDQGDDAGDMGSGKAVSRCDAGAAIQPRHLHVDPQRAEFNRRGRVVVIRHRLMTVMSGNRYDRGIK